MRIVHINAQRNQTQARDPSAPAAAPHHTDHVIVNAFSVIVIVRSSTS